MSSKFLTASSVILSSALLTRLLPPEQIGLFFLLTSLATPGANLAQLGLGTIAVRGVAGALGLNDPARARVVIGEALRWQWAGVISIGFLFVLGGWWLGFEPALIGLGVLWMGVGAWHSLLNEILRGFQDVRAMANLDELVAGLVFTALLFAFWLLRFRLGLVEIIVFKIIAGGAALVLVAWILSRVVAVKAPPVFTSFSGESEHILVQAWPVFITNLSVTIFTQLDIWILSLWQTRAEVAVYGAAARLMSFVTVPLVIVNSVLPPVIAQLYAQQRIGQLEKVLRRAATLAGIPAFLALLFLILGRAPVLRFVYGDFYTAGATVLILLSIGQFVNVWTGSCGLTLFMTGNQKTLMRISLARSILAGAAMLLLGRSYGMVAVAAVAAAAVVLSNLLVMLAVKQKVGIWTHMWLWGG